MKQGLLLLAALAMLTACASGPDRPTAEIARAEATIEQAEQSGARQYATAELDRAREKLAAAQSLADQDEMELARRHAEQAILDAELASAMARNRKAELAVDELNETIRTLREEIARNQDRSGGPQ